MTQITLDLNPIIKLTEEQFYLLCQENPDLKLERNPNGELIVMPPTGGETGKRNVKLIVQLAIWNEQTQLGEVFDSSTGFTLPNKADRSPDVSWVEKSRWEALTAQQREKFIPLCPDFVIEILSPSDSLKKTQDKMQEYIDNGCRLGLLINRKKQQVEIYRPDREVEVLQAPQTVSVDVLPGFTLNLRQIWD
ncbi:MAG: Uma2 family endonuclease [Microcoleus sp. PH2017_15_JOR_U_A]|jgi:Uma2 family endonuclease|uniref:Uma2 family endonuclease n=1 Tax=unclassified Microcoleus TaxID=2642155 RepID=UPI001DFF8ADB|nr:MULTISPECIES: Uma2 family endonuclease [unclassified Microcoleus]MCC3508330.1 Uma2 family endonuclease [Microcoleus sp. PH2017_17_BER_D_A]TAE51401.1 MAG: Uma2 family endonuclease [Oscillatoriales cyanobacterium]MCC3473958.1 Uma2 family endonuclease [Microcoleus sp. PH2017_13_LAR_U_A]MCC3486043.1 Uma2 family endonuclease [Microcoleus sp. PH2017_14_LAR_D_A]MCC3498389.1 Uma2 family endonuclease [Microcoleus sp. PH2017_15_JOR_U_A]